MNFGVELLEYFIGALSGGLTRFSVWVFPHTFLSLQYTWIWKAVVERIESRLFVCAPEILIMFSTYSLCEFS